MKKIIITDLDGTLLYKDKTLSLASANYLNELKNEGYIVVVDTGRVLASALNVTQNAYFANYVISDAGGVIYDAQNKKVLFESDIDNHIAKNICALYDDSFDYIDICTTNLYNKYTSKETVDTHFSHKINDLEKFLEITHNITHMSIFLNDYSKIEDLHKKLSDFFPDLYLYVMQDSLKSKRWIELFNKDISKYSGIERLMNIIGENINNTIAFGDGLNDIEMLQKCSIGVAMGNALDETKKVADYIALPNSEDGEMEFLKNYLNN